MIWLLGRRSADANLRSIHTDDDRGSLLVPLNSVLLSCRNCLFIEFRPEFPLRDLDIFIISAGFNMDLRKLIDAQFDRAVEIVQGLPKTGPIQTGYEEKLTMYSLYKQATVGNVQPPRPSVWDMLGRAKWDEWAKHKDLDSYEAKWLYVDALLKVLRKYSDKTVAMDLVRELESYNGDASNLVMSGSLSRSRSSSSSNSSSEAGPSGSNYPSDIPAHLRNNQASLQGMPHLRPPHRAMNEHDDTTSEEEGEEDDEVDEPLPELPSVYAQSHMNRPQSSMSSHRYRTPMASMLLSPPPISTSVPPTQPRPHYETPSAYAEHTPAHIPPPTYPPSTVSFPSPFTHASRAELVSPPEPYPIQPPYRSASQQQFPNRQYPLPGRMTPRPVLERAVENLQAHLAALTERIEHLENLQHHSMTSLTSPGGSRSPQWSGAGRGSSPFGRGGPPRPWDMEDMGMWYIVLTPLSAVVARFQQLRNFLMYNENRSPTLVVVRRLFLDISFLLCLLAIVKMAWRRSGMRRKEVVGALRGLWLALAGHKRPRVLIDRAV